MRLFFCLLSCVGVTLQAAFAQEIVIPNPQSVPPAPVIAPVVIDEPEITLDELIQRALQNNPQLPLARELREAARHREAALRALPNPQIELVPGFSGSREARDEEIILAQPLDVFGQRRAQRRVAQAELSRAQAEVQMARRTLIVEVKNAATQLFAAQEAEKLGRVQVEVAQLFRAAAARKAELGEVAPVQVQRADLELLRAQNELAQYQSERWVQRAALNQLIGQAPVTPLRVALPELGEWLEILREPSKPEVVESAPMKSEPMSDASASQPVIGDSAQIGGEAIAQRPDLVSAQADLAARRAEVDAIARQRWPQIELQARRSAFFGREGSTAVRAVLTLPLLDFGSIGREKKAAQAQVRAQEAQIALLRTQAATEIETARVQVRHQRETVERFRTGIVPQTLDLLRKTQIGYEAGASNYLEVVEAQRTARAVQTEYLQALVGLRTKEIALQNALGAQEGDEP